MKMEKFQNALDMLDDNIISETGKARNGVKKNERLSIFIKYGSVAACFCILICCGLIALITMNSKNEAPDSNVQPEKIEITEEIQKESSEITIENELETQDISNTKNEKSEETAVPEIETENKLDNNTVNLSATLTTADDTIESCDDPKEYSITFSEYALSLFRAVYKGESNEMISPISISYALGMTANGAKGETLTQIEDLLGMNKDEFNDFLRCYMSSLPNGEGYKLSTANSLWMRNTYAKDISNKYLKALMKHYNAEVYSAPFINSTVKDINDWISDKTDGMIDKVDIDLYMNSMIIINAICFESEWNGRYEIQSTEEYEFIKPDGSTTLTEFMCGKLDPDYNNYIEDEQTTGFIKFYKDKNYAFVALLPKEDVSIEEFVNGLTGKRLNSLIVNAESKTVKIRIPIFEASYENNMKKTLQNLGVKDAFDSNTADFSALNDISPVYLSDVIHKTYIKVDVNGTQAGAVTANPFLPMGPAPNDSDAKQVFLNRPFVYVIIDCENSIPLFFGTLSDPTVN